MKRLFSAPSALARPCKVTLAMQWLLPLTLLPWFSIDWQERLWSFAIPFHELCLALAPAGPYTANYQSLVCGANLPQNEFFLALQKTSLLHLAIVSGSHLVLLEVLLKKFIRFEKPIFGLLTLYTLATGAQPPAVRAMATVALQMARTRWKLRWRGHQLTLFSGVLTWAFFPMWAHSFSFLLSWTASLGLSTYSASDREPLIEQWRTHLIIYLLLLPVLAPFGLLHPVSIAFNWLLGPLLSLAFFPLSLLAFLLPFLSPATDLMWLAAETFLTTLSPWVPTLEMRASLHAIELWPYVFAVHILLHTFEIYRGRPR